MGGFEKGIIDALGEKNVEIVGFSENDKYCSSVLRFHFPMVKNYGDITRLQGGEIPDADLYTAGVPCQDVSLAGKRRGLKGRRTGLFFDFLRILEAKKPCYFIFENVKGLLFSNGGFDFARVLSDLSSLGYSLQWQIINAIWMGVPQNRERIFIIGVRDGSSTQVFFKPESTRKNNETFGSLTQELAHSTGRRASTLVDVTEKKTGVEFVKRQRNEFGKEIRKDYEAGNAEAKMKDIRDWQIVKQDVSNTISGVGIDNLIVEDKPKMIHTAYQGRAMEYEEYAPTISTPSGGGHLPYVIGDYRYDEGFRPRKDGIAPTINREAARQDGHNLLLKSGLNIRRLTPTECEALMSWEKNWTKWGIDEKGNKIEISDTQRYRMAGNGVVSVVVKALVEELFKKEKAPNATPI